MSQSYQNLASDQICKVQNDKKLISFHDRLRAALPGSYAQIHAKGEFSENNHKVHSLIGVSIQDYSNGTGDRNIITRFHLSPEQVQFFLTRLTAGFQEYEWSISKIFGEPDQYGYSTAQQFSISRHSLASDGREMKNPWRIQIINGRGIKVQNRNGGSYMQSGSFQMDKSAFIQLTDMDLYLLLKRVDAYVASWDNRLYGSWCGIDRESSGRRAGKAVGFFLEADFDRIDDACRLSWW